VPLQIPAFLGNFITGDETWVYGYDPETRVQSSSQWKSPSSPRAKKSASIKIQHQGDDDDDCVF